MADRNDVFDNSPRFRMRPGEMLGTPRDLATDMEACALIDLVAAEFESDPMSVQCFDLRIVERVKACALKIKKMEHR